MNRKDFYKNNPELLEEEFNRFLTGFNSPEDAIKTIDSIFKEQKNNLDDKKPVNNLTSIGFYKKITPFYKKRAYKKENFSKMVWNLESFKNDFSTCVQILIFGVGGFRWINVKKCEID